MNKCLRFSKQCDTNTEETYASIMCAKKDPPASYCDDSWCYRVGSYMGDCKEDEKEFWRNDKICVK